MKKSALLTLITIIISVPLPLLFADSEGEYWNSYKASLNLNDHLTALVVPEFRFNNCLENYYTHIEIHIDWKIKKWISLCTNYRHIFTKKDNGWELEYRPNMDLVFIQSLENFNLSNRSRIELRIKNKDASFRYRNKTSCKLSKITLLHIHPYIAEEFFYDFQVNKINKNRIYAGIEFPLGHKFGAIASYILESNKREINWQDTNIVKLDLKYNIN